jgi:hypothetical protein
MKILKFPQEKDQKVEKKVFLQLALNKVSVRPYSKEAT